MTAWTPAALALALLCGCTSRAAAHEHHQTSAGLAATGRENAGVLLAQETRTLGRSHALEHLAERRAARRMAARRAAMSPAQRRAADRRVITAHAAAVAGENPGLDGRWDPDAFELPTYAIHSAMLPTGKVLFYGYPYSAAPNRPERGDAWIWDPAKGHDAAAFQHVPPPLMLQAHPDDPQNPDVPDQIFCSGQSFLPDGQILVTGGNRTWQYQQGIKRVYTFNPWAAGTAADPFWTRQPDLQSGRWYPSQVELADGRIYIIGGYGEDGALHRDADLFTPGTGLGAGGSTQPAPAAASRSLDNYPHLFLLGNGDVGSVSAAYVAPDNPTGILRVASDPAHPHWDAAMDSSIKNMNQPQRGYAAAVLEPGQTGPTGRVTIMGGFGAWSDAFGGWPASATTESIDFLADDPQWQKQSPLNVARSNEDVVLLPDGSMLAVGGGNGQTSATGNYSATGAERRVEIWDPTTRTWRLGAEQRFKRAYHSTALLLPDGRVWSAGDDQHFTGQEAWSVGGDGKAIENADSDHAEIYSPPYLFDDDGSLAARPSITSAPSAMPWDVPFWLGAKERVARAVLVAPSAVTHKVNMNQRHVELRVIERQDGTGARILAPPSPNVAPPGYYMLFLLDQHGVPSIARWVRLGADAPRPASDPPPPDPIDPGEGTGGTGGTSTNTTTTTTTTDTTAAPSAAEPSGGGVTAPGRAIGGASGGAVLPAPRPSLKTGSARALRASRRLVVVVRARRAGKLTLRVTLGSGSRAVRLPVITRTPGRAGTYTLSIRVSAIALRRATPKHGRLRIGLAARQAGSVAVGQAEVTLS